MLGMFYSAEVHRFDLLGPERLKSNRTDIRSQAGAIARWLFC